MPLPEHLAQLPHCTEMTHGCRRDVRPEADEDSSGLLAHGDHTRAGPLLSRMGSSTGQGLSFSKESSQGIMGLVCCKLIKGLPRWHSDKESAGQRRRCKRLGVNPWWGRSPVEGSSNPLWYSCLENLMHRGGWRATVHGVAKSGTRPKPGKQWSPAPPHSLQ